MMESWPLLVTAGATFLLALAAFWAIWQNHSLQRRERKERLLNEIIEWALDIAKCGLEKEFVQLLAVPDKGLSTLQQMINTFRALQRKGRHISNIVLPSWHGLHDTIEEMKKQLYVQTKYLTEYIEKPTESNFENANKHRDDVITLANKVIDEACHFLTRDIN